MRSDGDGDGDGLVEGLLRARLGSGLVIQMALGLLLHHDLRAIRNRKEGWWWARTITYSGWNR